MKTAILNSKIKSSTQSGAYKIMLLFAFILHIGVFIYFMINTPIHTDEVMTVLNANSLAKSGTDILGEKLPIYFDTWLYGGQSPFATYLVAIMIKLFGYSLFVTRVPMFVFSMLGLVAFYKFLKEVIPENETLINITFCLACISPWHLYSSAFTLDCNFLPHIAMFGMYFLAKGINSKKSKYFVFSMLFFGLGFYCYILSAIIIPVLLAALFLILLIKKKVSFKNTIISVITIFIVAIPFILQGLVQFGIVENLNFLGFSISKMPYYNRAVESSSSFIENVVSGFAFTVFPDLVTINSCSFNYQNSFGGILLLLGIIYLIITRKKELSLAKIIVISFSISACISFGFAYFYSATYRFNIYNYIFILGTAFGIQFISSAKIKNIGKITIIALIISSLAISGCSFAYYFNKDKIESDIFYEKSITNSLDFAENKTNNNIDIVYSNNNIVFIKMARNQRLYISTMFKYINEYDSSNAKEEMLNIYINSKNPNENTLKIKNNNSINFVSPKKILNDDVFIAETNDISTLKYDKKLYKYKSFGVYTVFYK